MTLCSILGHKWSRWLWNDVPHRWCLRCHDIQLHKLNEQIIAKSADPATVGEKP